VAQVLAFVDAIRYLLLRRCIYNRESRLTGSRI
jgi:hypothetical protein